MVARGSRGNLRIMARVPMHMHPQTQDADLYLDTIPGIDPGPLDPTPGTDEPDFDPNPAPDPDPDPLGPATGVPGIDPGYPAPGYAN